MKIIWLLLFLFAAEAALMTKEKQEARRKNVLSMAGISTDLLTGPDSLLNLQRLLEDKFIERTFWQFIEAFSDPLKHKINYSDRP